MSKAPRRKSCLLSSLEWPAWASQQLFLTFWLLGPYCISGFLPKHIWGWIILCCGHCFVHCRQCSIISGLYPLDWGKLQAVSNNPKCLWTFPDVPLGAESQLVETTHCCTSLTIRPLPRGRRVDQRSIRKDRERSWPPTHPLIRSHGLRVFGSQLGAVLPARIPTAVSRATYFPGALFWDRQHRIQ